MEAKHYPRECRFVVSFVSEHLTTEGRWITQNQKRFMLADSAADALQAVRDNLADHVFWPPEFHRARNVTVSPCPDAAAFVGYGRFSGPADVRKVKSIIYIPAT